MDAEIGTFTVPDAHPKPVADVDSSDVMQALREHFLALYEDMADNDHNDYADRLSIGLSGVEGFLQAFIGSEDGSVVSLVVPRQIAERAYDLAQARAGA